MHPLIHVFHSFSYVECLAVFFFEREVLILNHVVFKPLLRIAFKRSGREDSKTHLGLPTKCAKILS